MKKLTLRQKALIDAYNKMLSIAKDRYNTAINKNDTWGIAHYANDIRIIENELILI
jgi:hypothetical protein